MRRIIDVPLTVILLGISSVMMLVPMLHAAVVRDWADARVFLYSFILFGFLTALLAFATVNSRSRDLARSYLSALVLAYLALPAVLAVPFYEAVGNTTFLNAWAEMVSAITTTGAAYYDPARLSPTEHIWRAVVGWMGGYFSWVAAIALLAPMNLGGFEVISRTEAGAGVRPGRRLGEREAGDPRERFLRVALRLLPIYGTLTLVLWICLVIAGERTTVAFIHALSTLATSGITSLGSYADASGGRWAEVIVFCFFIFGLSRVSYLPDSTRIGRGDPLSDPELRIAALALVVLPTILVLRHWIGAIDVDSEDDLASALRAVWGNVFAVWSFLSTTGFESADWEAARTWSGLQTPGLVLLGLALMGGGVATTAGGVKLLRVYALYKHSARELERLLRPHSVAGAGQQARQIRRKGAYVAWVFFMLFGLSFALVASLLAATGSSFEEALVLTAAALSTCGPLAHVVTETPISYGDLEPAGRVVLSVAMVLGRLETLAIIALLNPSFWQR